MKIGLTVELMSPRGSVAFQSQVPVADESIRTVRKELKPGKVWRWQLAIPRERIAVFAAQSMGECCVAFNAGDVFDESFFKLTLEGQNTTDFGIMFARRGEDTFGSLPFEGDLVDVVFWNVSDKKNRVDVFVGELEEVQDEESDDSV